MQNTRYAFQILIKLEFSRQFFEKSSNTKFNENPSSGSRVVHADRRNGRTDGRKDMTKLIVAFRKFASPSKNKDVLQERKTFDHSNKVAHRSCTTVQFKTVWRRKKRCVEGGKQIRSYRPGIQIEGLRSKGTPELLGCLFREECFMLFQLILFEGERSVSEYGGCD